MPSSTLQQSILYPVREGVRTTFAWKRGRCSTSSPWVFYSQISLPTTDSVVTEPVDHDQMDAKLHLPLFFLFSAESSLSRPCSWGGVVERRARGICNVGPSSTSSLKPTPGHLYAVRRSDSVFMSTWQAQVRGHVVIPSASVPFPCFRTRVASLVSDATTGAA